LPLYLIAVEMTGDRRVGVLASAILGLSLLHVYATSHPVPGALGSIFGLFTIYFLLRVYRTGAAWLPLLLCAGALVMTHHMTSLIIFLAVLLSCMFRLVLGHRTDFMGRMRKDIAFLGALLLMMSVFWGFAAEPFAQRIWVKGTGTSLWPLTIGGLALLGAMWWAASRRHRWTKYTHWPGERGAGGIAVRFALIQSVLIFFLVWTTFIAVPGTNISVPLVSLVWSVPTVVFGAFLALGTTFTRRMEDGMLLYGWAFIVVILAVFAMVSRSEEILYYRLAQYIIEPISIFMAAGLLSLPSIWRAGRDGRPVVPAMRPRQAAAMGGRLAVPRGQCGAGPVARGWEDRLFPVRARLGAAGMAGFGALLVTVLLITALTAYPSKEVMGGFNEGTTPAEMDGVIWFRDELTAGLSDDGAVLSDHRYSSMLFGYAGADASWDSGGEMIHSDELNPRERELRVPAGDRVVEYTAITADMESGTALKQWEPARSISEEGREKYDSGMWKLYDNGEAAVYGWADGG